MNDTCAARVRHECYTNDTSVTRVKSFDFDSDKSKNIFLHLYIYYMASERLQGDEQFHSMNYLLEMHQTCTTKTKLFNDKSYVKISTFFLAKTIES